MGADYWKSNPRKFCDFCRCWIADNKISVALHEDGRRHKDNVSKKISIIQKQSAKDRKAQNRLDNEMAKMEKVAMAAYMKDILNNADLTSQIINEKLSTKSRIDVKKDEVTSSSTSSRTPASYYHSEKKRVWREVINEGGHSYYWNVETNEAVWEAPPEGYIPYSDLKTQPSISKQPPKPPKKGKKKKGGNDDESDLTESNAKESDNKDSETYFDPLIYTRPYGSWVTVKKEEVDLQLPEKKFVPVVAPAVIIPPEKRFKEKQITSLCTEDDAGAPDVEFKKRKINSNAKRNTRQRLEDD